MGNHYNSNSAIGVLREFVDDVRCAYGTGRGYKINESALDNDWPDLRVTYDKAVQLIQRVDKRGR